MKVILALLCFVLALGFVAGGAYLGIWVMLVGGIVGIIEQVKAPQVESMTLAINIAKVIFFEAPFGIGLFLGFISVGGGVAALR